MWLLYLMQSIWLHGRHLYSPWESRWKPISRNRSIPCMADRASTNGLKVAMQVWQTTPLQKQLENRRLQMSLFITIDLSQLDQRSDWFLFVFVFNSQMELICICLIIVNVSQTNQSDLLRNNRTCEVNWFGFGQIDACARKCLITFAAWLVLCYWVGFLRPMAWVQFLLDPLDLIG